MIARIWRATYDQAKFEELKKFAVEISAPFLTTQPGNKGLQYLSHDGVWLTVTYWTDHAAYQAMEAREDYKEISRKIEETGSIKQVQSVEVFHVQPTGVAPILSPDP